MANLIFLGLIIVTYLATADAPVVSLIEVSGLTSTVLHLNGSKKTAAVGDCCINWCREVRLERELGPKGELNSVEYLDDGVLTYCYWIYPSFFDKFSRDSNLLTLIYLDR